MPPHQHSTGYESFINVAYATFKIARKLGSDPKLTAHGGLLHNLFYDDWCKFKLKKGHAWTHSGIAVGNARKLANVNHKEEGIILKHLWGVSIALAPYKGLHCDYA